MRPHPEAGQLPDCQTWSGTPVRGTWSKCGSRALRARLRQSKDMSNELSYAPEDDSSTYQASLTSWRQRRRQRQGQSQVLIRDERRLSRPFRTSDIDTRDRPNTHLGSASTSDRSIHHGDALARLDAAASSLHEQRPMMVLSIGTSSDMLVDDA